MTEINDTEEKKMSAPLLETRNGDLYFTGELIAGKRLAQQDRHARLTTGEQPDPEDKSQRITCHVVELYSDWGTKHEHVAEWGTSCEDFTEAWRWALGAYFGASDWDDSDEERLARELEAVAGALM